MTLEARAPDEGWLVARLDSGARGLVPATHVNLTPHTPNPAPHNLHPPPFTLHLTPCPLTCALTLNVSKQKWNLC